jgi:hypothetical protein
MNTKSLTLKKKVRNITALCIYDSNRVALIEGKSKEHQADIYKLPQIKHDPATDGKYNETDQRRALMDKFLGKNFDENNIVSVRKYGVDKWTEFTVLYVNITSLVDGIKEPVSYRLTIDLTVPYKKIPVRGGAKLTLLPSIVEAVRYIPKQ